MKVLIFAVFSIFCRVFNPYLTFEQRRALRIEVDRRVPVPLQNRGRTIGADPAAKRTADRIGLLGARDSAENMGNGGQHRHRQRDGIHRNLLQCGETAVVDLLHAAFQIEIDRFDHLRVVEPRHMGIVEGQVTVLPDAEKAEIQRMLPEQPRIPGAGGVGVAYVVSGR